MLTAAQVDSVAAAVLGCWCAYILRVSSPMCTSEEGGNQMKKTVRSLSSISLYFKWALLSTGRNSWLVGKIDLFK